MRTLVTGSTGFLGEALVLDLVAAHGSASVTALVREPIPERERPAAERLAAAGVRVVAADLLALPVCRRPLADFDVLYHLAAETDSGAPPARLAVNDRGTAHLLETIGEEALAGRRVVLAGATAAVDRGRRPRSGRTIPRLPARPTAARSSRPSACSRPTPLSGGSTSSSRGSVRSTIAPCPRGSCGPSGSRRRSGVSRGGWPGRGASRS
ncbi:MAG: NAD-dependent epimerase/dehydratase family protein [Planctomycetes bacterium]|nr:NAD-dependent epimerase/dehydratase family protein [Planctomycetota bacterium]